MFTHALWCNGATKALVELLKRADYSRYEIDLMVLDQSNIASWTEEIPKNVNIVSVPVYGANAKTLGQVLRHPLHFLRALAAGKSLRTKLSDIEGMQYTAARLPFADKKYDIAVSFRHFDIDTFYVIENVAAKIKYCWCHGVQAFDKEEITQLRQLYSKYNEIFPVSESAKSNLINYFPEIKNKLRVAYCVIDSKEIKEKASCSDICFPKNNGKYSILTIGRLAAEKGIDLALDTAILLRKRKIDFRWCVVGEGPMRNILEKRIYEEKLEDIFVLVGNIANPYRMMAQCDIYVQPSKMESYGLTVNEAKIFNKLIVCSNIPAFQEQIQNGINGQLVKNNTPEEFADAIQKFVLDKEFVAQCRSALSEFDWSHFEAANIFNSL